MVKTKKQLLVERAANEAALLRLEEAEQKEQQEKARAERDEWCAEMLTLIEEAPLCLSISKPDNHCLLSNLIAARALLERLLAEDRDA